jgi:hypothetical protein
VAKIWTLSKRETIQLQYIIAEDLSSYKERVELGQWDFPAFRQCCPLCDGSNCPKRIGYYDRGVVDESGQRYRINIARYLCRRKGPIEPLQSSFSLLPYQLIPYLSHTIEITLETVSFWLEDNSILDVQDYASSLGLEVPLEIGTSTLYRLKELVKEAFDKAVIQGDYKAEVEGGLEGFIECCKGFHYQSESWEIAGPLAICVDYYNRSGGDFLLGSPSQQRIKRELWKGQRENFFSDTQPRYPP